MDTDEECIFINGRYFYSRPRAKGFNEFSFNGIRYVTLEEMWVAKMLTALDIPFLYEVEFIFQDVLGNEHIWCPDFVFPWHKWLGSECHKSAILGIEVKRRSKPFNRSILLANSFDIPILMQNRTDLLPYYKKHVQKQGGLPLRPIAH